VPFTSLHAGKDWREDITNIETTKAKDSPQKQTTQNTAKQNCPGSVASYDVCNVCIVAERWCVLQN